MLCYAMPDNLTISTLPHTKTHFPKSPNLTPTNTTPPFSDLPPISYSRSSEPESPGSTVVGPVPQEDIAEGAYVFVWLASFGISLYAYVSCSSYLLSSGVLESQCRPSSTVFCNITSIF